MLVVIITRNFASKDEFKNAWLVYFEHFKYINDAIAKEKEVKKRREKKEALIICD